MRRLELPGAVELRLGVLTREVTATTGSVEQVRTANLAWKRKTFRRDAYAPALGRLKEMAPGHDCCMYCGQNLADHIDHYVPINVDPLQAFSWLNYLLACSTCNSRFKKGAHAVDDTGIPMLVNPTVEDPFVHLHLVLDTGEYCGLSPRGEYTVSTCGLNADKRPEARRHARNVMSLALERWWTARDRGLPDEMSHALSVIRDQPFAGVFQAMLRQAVRSEADLLFAGIRDNARLLDILRSPGVQNELRISV
ncbi:HNH endonuclease [Kitasatospora sp. NPDC096140]|uniref:HNH endonuclease n=1 Tax=Kitasatospora sp. NPDC096140 TaxID=3155425 RepID=UPI003327B2F8